MLCPSEQYCSLKEIKHKNARYEPEYCANSVNMQEIESYLRGACRLFKTWQGNRCGGCPEELEKEGEVRHGP